MKCTQCESERLIANVLPVDEHRGFDRNMKLEICKDPGAILFGGAERAPLEAMICVDCGFVMFRISKEAAARFERVIRERDGD